MQKLIGVVVYAFLKWEKLRGFYFQNARKRLCIYCQMHSQDILILQSNSFFLFFQEKRLMRYYLFNYC